MIYPVSAKSYPVRARSNSNSWPKSYFRPKSILHQNLIPSMSESKILFKIVTQIKAHNIPRECKLRAKAVRAKAMREKAMKEKAKYVMLEGSAKYHVIMSVLSVK